MCYTQSMRALRATPFSWCLAVGLAIGVSACGTQNEEDEEGHDPIGVIPSAYSIDPSDFSLPPSDPDARAAILKNYDHLDPQSIVPRGLLEDAVEYFDINKANFPVHSYITVVDFSKFSGDDRFFLIDMDTGEVEPHKVSHGDGSDPNHTGYATEFSNISGSHMTSLGFYITGAIYDGTHLHSMYLDGLSPDGSPNQMGNTNARSRSVVVHEASYVSDSNTSKQGRSQGCLALDPDIEVEVVDRIHDGSLIYAAIEPLNTPVGKAEPQEDAGAEAAVDAGPDAIDAASSEDSGSESGSDAAVSNDSGAADSAPSDAGGDGSSQPAVWGYSSDSGGCAIARSRGAYAPFAMGAGLLALGVVRVRRRVRGKR